MRSPGQGLATSRFLEGEENEPLRTRFYRLLFFLLALETVFSVPYRSVYLGTHSPAKSWIAAAFVLLCVGLCLSVRDSIFSFLRTVLSGEKIGLRSWLGLWLLAGLFLRLLWAIAFPVALKSDGLAYFTGAESLATTHTYSGAFWPPGSSLFLAPFVMVFGAHVWVSALCAILLFVVTYLVSCRFAEGLAGEGAARVTGPVLALWPGYLSVVGINSKEGLLAFLLVSAMLAYLRFTEAKGSDRWLWILLSGGLLGAVTLTQPGYLFFPAVIAGFEILRTRKLLSSVVRTAVFSLALMAVVAPWTFRNYLVFHRFIPVSTNGGSVFYRANNPKANASYSPEGEIVLPKDEFEADKVGYAEAKKWILHHPVDFTVLAVRKQVVYLGDDAIGMYETLKRDQEPSEKLYALAKAICNGYWLLLWSVLLLATPWIFRMRGWERWYGLCFLPLVYQWLIDSVFESGSRHHISYVAFVAMLVGIAISQSYAPASGEHTTSGKGRSQTSVI